MIRFAAPSDGEAIRELVVSNGMNRAFAARLNWKTVDQSWLVAVDEQGVVQGAIQVCFGTPIARVEHSAVDQRLDGMARARLIRDLGLAALALCKQLGASAVTGFVCFENKTVKKNYKKRGLEAYAQGNMMGKVLE